MTFHSKQRTYVPLNPNHHIQQSYCFTPYMSRNAYECRDTSPNSLEYAIMGQRRPQCFRTHSKRNDNPTGLRLENLLHEVVACAEPRGSGRSLRRSLRRHGCTRCVDDLTNSAFSRHYPKNINTHFKPWSFHNHH